MRPARDADPFRGIRNIGAAARADLAVLRIASVEQLAASDPDELYTRLQVKTGKRHDPCAWDVFAAAIHQARTGQARNWWEFTPVRKKRMALGEFPKGFSL
jgi:hypothetical protein